MEKKLIIRPDSSIRSQIIEFYRSGIRSGEFPEGYVLPPARKLAREIGTAEANVHHAFAALVREGLIVRRPRAGSVVITPRRLHRVAFFFSSYYTLRGERFSRPLIEGVEHELDSRGIECQVIYETGSGEGIRLLKQLAAERQIQGVIMRSAAEEDLAWLARLPIPFAAISALRIPGAVNFSSRLLAREMVLGLAEQGCRRIGAVSTVFRSGTRMFQEELRHAALECGLDFDPLRFVTPREGEARVEDYDCFAVRALDSLLSLQEPPDGVMVFSDNLVPGVTMELYRRRLAVPEQLKLSIHHTVENPLSFPFSCVLVENRISELAALLVGRLTDLFEGRPPRPGELGVTRRRWEPGTGPA